MKRPAGRLPYWQARWSNGQLPLEGVFDLLAGLPHQSSLPPLSIGFVSVIGVILIAPVSSYVAPFGARLAHALPKRRLEIGFGLFLIAAAMRFVVSLVVG